MPSVNGIHVSIETAPVLIHILSDEGVKIQYYDVLQYVDSEKETELRGRKAHVEVEATETEEAYAKLISHLTERALTAERELENLKSESTTVTLPLESQEMIAKDIYHAVRKAFNERRMND